MSFIIFTNSMTADADDMNKNFYHVGRGDLIPRGGANLVRKNEIYDLGSASYRWSKIYVDVLDYSGEITADGKILTLIEDYTVSETLTYLNFSDLNGDTDDIYLFEINFVRSESTSVHLYLTINNDWSTYTQRQWMDYDGSTATSGQTGVIMMTMAAVYSTPDTSENSYVKFFMQAKRNGSYRGFDIAVNNSASVDGSESFSFAKGQWGNTSDTITSFVFTGTMTAGTNFKIWSLR